jgi:hypothetical protein
VKYVRLWWHWLTDYLLIEREKSLFPVWFFPVFGVIIVLDWITIILGFPQPLATINALCLSTLALLYLWFNRREKLFWKSAAAMLSASLIFVVALRVVVEVAQ